MDISTGIADLDNLLQGLLPGDNFNMYYWTEKEVYERLDAKMTTAYHAVYDTHKDYKINMRQAAYVRAVERVVEAMKLRGWV